MQWLATGWADIAFRRPVFPDDLLTVGIALTAVRGGGSDQRIRIDGRIGIGDAAWLGELARSTHTRLTRPRIRCPR
jgi:hypothetical protein